ncbi:Alpha-protein kinase vwkA [Geodia barretti]|uniref:Alpha-protein kinase vwkA n=1 Tax=Geodia barretti TaxID=519541 RepID=A0AA35WLK6_GEOBA|nr:Alpha-protein kinase vwkA [Geodia barretti]
MEEDRQARFKFKSFAEGRFRRARFESKSFGQGKFRRAYRGKWTAPRYAAGHTCVVKEFKETYTWKPTDWDETVIINDRAKELAAGFNDAVTTTKPISFTDVHVMEVVSTSDPYTTPRLHEWVTGEDFIPGTFNKWCNNYGYISTESSSLPGFMHWSWYDTRGEEMVADLQGVRNSDSFKLTDPVIISLEEGYGATDMGVEGMAMFFLNHKCNIFCRDLPAPKLAHFRRVIPQPYLEAAKTLMAQVYNSTTYRMELKFPQDIRGRVAARFREIATN